MSDRSSGRFTGRASLLRTQPTEPPPWLLVIRQRRQQCDSSQLFFPADRAIAGSSGDQGRGRRFGPRVLGGLAGQLLQQRH
jgi:hypothetical protein